MLVVRSRYTRSLEEVDGLRAEHLAWIAGHVEAGRVLAAGRQSPPDGGVILMSDVAPDDVTAFFADDPYVLGGVAEYEALVEFKPGVAGPGLEALLG